MNFLIQKIWTISDWISRKKIYAKIEYIFSIEIVLNTKDTIVHFNCNLNFFAMTIKSNYNDKIMKEIRIYQEYTNEYNEYY